MADWIWLVGNPLLTPGLNRLRYVHKEDYDEVIKRHVEQSLRYTIKWTNHNVASTYTYHVPGTILMFSMHKFINIQLPYEEASTGAPNSQMTKLK